MKESSSDCIENVDATISSLKELIESKDYDTAAALIADLDCVIENCTERLAQLIILRDGKHVAASQRLLQIASDGALSQARKHFEVLRASIELIPPEDQNAGLSKAIQLAMERSALLREKLMNQVNDAIKVLQC